MKLHRLLSNRTLFFCLTVIGIILFVGALISNQLSAQPPSGELRIEISAGKPVVPSEFVGDVRNLPQVITPAERKLFHPPMELEFDLPRHKKPLPGARA